MLILSPQLFTGAETNSDPDPLLREKLDPDPQKNADIRVRSAPHPLPPLLYMFFTAVNRKTVLTD